MLSGPLTDAGPRLDAIRARLQDEHPELFAD